MSNTLEEKFGAVCDSPWITSERNEDEIIGRWAEDGSCYSITCPSQLRGQIIALQNQICHQLHDMRLLLSEFQEKERVLSKVLCE